MDFSKALVKLKQGKVMYRKGWVERKIVAMQKGYPEGIPCNAQTAACWGLKQGDIFKCNPYFQVMNQDGSFSMWFPSCDDFFAEDWEVGIEKEN